MSQVYVYSTIAKRWNIWIFHLLLGRKSMIMGRNNFFSIKLRSVERASIFSAAINKSNNFEFAESEFECL